MKSFTTFVFSPAGLNDPTLAIAASRAGAVGVLNLELDDGSAAALAAVDRMARHARGEWGLCIDRLDDTWAARLQQAAGEGLQWLVLPDALALAMPEPLAQLRARGVRVLAQVVHAPPLAEPLLSAIDGVMVKGNEAGGFVGEDASFILLQKWLKACSLPLVLRGGLTPHVAAACAAVGVAGGVLESQLLLLDEVRLPQPLRTLIGNLAGSETVGVGDGEHGEYFRLLVRPQLAAARHFVTEGEGLDSAALRDKLAGRVGWQDLATALLPIGQEVAFAASWKKRHGTLAQVLAAVDAAVTGHPALLAGREPLAENAPLARALGLRYPIVQGPMTRVSDSAAFALNVAEGGALPMLAFAMLKGKALEDLLVQSSKLLDGKPWGIGLLGFAPQELLDEQLGIATRFKPSYAVIAGGRPDQAVHLERSGVPAFLHLPAASLVSNFLQEGARRFIFEGRECGGHIGPLSSFVLWSTMVDKLLDELGPGKVRADEVELLFAGGVHDALSAAMMQVLVAPLVAAGAKVGVLMGSAYLFTKEIVDSGAIVQPFQQEVIECTHTVNLESGPGHASRCGYTPFARDFFETRREHRRQNLPADESRRLLDDLILGRLRIASKGSKREGLNGALKNLTPEEQRAEGMYMLGQVATLRDQVTSIERLHHEVTAGAAALLAERRQAEPQPLRPQAAPADIAIVGIATVVAQANQPREYWENIVNKVDAITEIPSHRWDWRLYFDADRNAKDKVYSKWGGFLDDLPFDPTRFGMPPKSIESVDPMQLMGLEVARRTLADAGYAERPFNREKASVILGASGGAGDFGMQYGLRSELPRFSGQLPAEVAGRLPEWTEDSFAGILPNVAAGRIANRLNFGGMNLAVDAACASSLAAVYHGVNELAAGRSDLVIAGGIDTVQGPFGYLCFSKTQALSPRGRCFTFDAHGDGICISEGIAMVAMKRLADAERDGDRIYAVIKGVGSSSDGSAKGMTAPLPAGQLRAMRRAYQMAGFGPSTVGLFEAHGTGTVAGDTAELESTTTLMLEEGAGARHAVIGSVKTNIGHTKATAGVAGLIKAAMALHRKVVPPHRNVTTPNKVLADPNAPLYLVDEATPWLARTDVPRRAACSAFGFGGTNFHVVMEEHAGEYRDWMAPPASDSWSAELLLWSDADAAGLAGRIEALLPKLQPGLVLRDLAASLAARWRGKGEVLAVVAKTVEDLQAKLAAVLPVLKGEARPLPPGTYRGTAGTLQGKVAILFPGQGSQYTGMAREAALHFDTVRETLEAADAVLADAFDTRFGTGQRLSRFVLPRGAYDDAAKAEARARLTSTDVAQPALGAVETGLYRLMREMGLAGDMFAGHSYGEFVALHAAGAIGFEALMTLSAARGRFIVDAASAEGAELGTMAAVNATRRIVEDAIADLDDVIIANHNAPLQSIISGTRAGVAAATEKLQAIGVEVTPIPVAAAFHSALVKPAQQPLSELIDSTPWQPLAAPVYSNGTARPHAADVARVKRQMAEHLTHPVEFVSQVEAMHADGARLFVEIGPKAVLTRLVGRILDKQPHQAIAIDDGSGLPGLLVGIAQLLCAGVSLDLGRLYARRDCRVGDPAEPAALRPPEAISRHAWLLNGSGARRASEPVRQIGVTLEQAQALAPATVAAQVAAPPAPVTPVTPVAAQPITAPAAVASVAARPLAAPSTAYRRSRPMDERRTAPGMADSSVMSEYFATMRQFLETQERVMSSFLGDAPAARALPMRSRAVPAVPMVPRVAEMLPPAAPVVVPAPVAAPVSPPVQAAAPVAPVAVAAPVAPVAVAPVAKAAPAPTPAPVKAAEPAAAATASLTREKLLDMLLAIVEEKTGYPRDMVGLDQNLESDLGIDSIKRIEVVGALLQQLPAAHRDALTEQRSKLNTQTTLNGMLELVAQAKVGGEVAVPFDVAGVGSTTSDAPVVAGHPPRLVMRPCAEPLAATMARRLRVGRFVITRDAGGVAEALAAALRARGCEIHFVDAEALAAEDTVLAAAAALGDAPVAGFVHLAALGTPALDLDAGPAAWRAAIQANEKSAFVLLRELLGRLGEGAHVMAASDLGGQFGREATASPALRLVGGGTGLLKTLREERPELRVKAVDLDPARSAEQRATDLLAELELDGGRQEVGYPGGIRTVFISAPEDLARDPARDAGLAGPLVVLATGGARGITAEVLRELAHPGNTLVLTGRSALPPPEAPDTAALPDAGSLRAHFVAQVRAGALKLTPGEIGRKVQQVLDQREMRANVADFQAAGATVEYHAVDVVDEAGLGALVRDLTARHGRIDGIVHGAGVIEDKLIADKRSDSWSRVVETKLIGLLLLARHVDVAKLRFLTVFSSVAGRYGNSGQSDYATANELMNRLCTQLQARWGDAVAVSALCWGPWGATQFGAGMVTAETEAKFAEKGVKLVSAALGRKLFRDELSRPAGTPVEVICGEAAWDAREAALGAIAEVALPSMGPLLGSTAATARPTGERIVPVRLDPKAHLYLQEHALDGKMVLPAAAALEIMAECARALWPGWRVTEVREHKLLKGVDMDAAGRDLQVFLSPPPYGSSEGFEVSASLQTDLGQGKALNHYRCVIRMEQLLPEGLPPTAAFHDERRLSTQRAYGEWLFHGPRFQVIEAFDGLSQDGAAARVRPSSPAEWLSRRAAGDQPWVFDPALLDAAAQMAWLWAREFRDESALPSRFGRVVRHRERVSGPLQMHYQRLTTADPTLIRANVVFTDADGVPVLTIEELDSIASAALNRLGGTARAAEDAAA